MTYSRIVTFLSAALLSSSALAYTAVPVVSGGVGESSRAALEDQQSAYNLKTVFTGQGGMYLSDVNVTIRDSAGNTVVSGLSDGPMMLAELQPGRYTLEASAGGYTKRQTIVVGQNLKTYHLSFPVKDESSGFVQNY